MSFPGIREVKLTLGEAMEISPLLAVQLGWTPEEILEWTLKEIQKEEIEEE